MSKSKGLEFDRTQPAFLQRLRGQISGQTGDPDRSIDAANRPKIPKRLEAGEDDGPTYVMEDGSTLTKDEFAAMEKGEEKSKDESHTDHEGAPKSDQIAESNKQKAGTIGLAKKRKAMKVIGGRESDDENIATRPSTTEALKTGKMTENRSGTADKKAPKKKKAKVKLDFGETENT